VLYRLRQRLRRELAPYQRHSRWWARRKYYGILLRRKLSLRRAYRTKKTLASGGIMIAVIGADGAGKSTVVDELCQWLSWKLNVRSYYMGSKEPSPISQAILVGVRIARKSHSVWDHLVGEKRPSTGILYRLHRSFRTLYHISTGWDRYRRYIAGRRQVSQGAVTIYDRYPLAAIHRVMEGRPMDGPRIAAEAGDKMGKLTKALAKVEQNIYQKIRLPDHLFVLHVTPHVSQQRKPEHEREMIEVKSQALRRMNPQNLCTTEIDADQPFEQVLRQAQTTLWKLF
jgi:thymidylate kinase